MELKMVFDNSVDVKTGKPVEAEISNEHVVDAERPLGLWPPHMSLDEIGEGARLAGQRFLAMFSK